MKPHNLYCRLATSEDAFAIMATYQKAAASVYEDRIFLEVRRLLQALRSRDFLWIVAGEEGSVSGAMSVKVDDEHRLCKIHRIYIDPGIPDRERLLREMLGFALGHLEREGICDVLYTTTHTLTLKQQETTIGFGFKILGIFPNAWGADPSRINGLTAYYFKDVLKGRRHGEFCLHPIIEPFYEIARRECGLAKLSLAKVGAPVIQGAKRCSTLEAIMAPAFVGRKFEKLRERKFLSVNFYPFLEPNTLITDPDQTIEIFIHADPEIRFAAIIGERLETPVTPVDLLNEVTANLRRMNISYIEVINDAADASAIDCIARAGFLPCAYFPCLKDHGEVRRDYVIFAKSYEDYHCPSGRVHPTQMEYLRAWYALQAGWRLYPEEGSGAA